MYRHSALKKQKKTRSKKKVAATVPVFDSELCDEFADVAAYVNQSPGIPRDADPRGGMSIEGHLVGTSNKPQSDLGLLDLGSRSGSAFMPISPAAVTSRPSDLIAPVYDDTLHRRLSQLGNADVHPLSRGVARPPSAVRSQDESQPRLNVRDVHEGRVHAESAQPSFHQSPSTLMAKTSSVRNVDDQGLLLAHMIFTT